MSVEFEVDEQFFYEFFTSFEDIEELKLGGGFRLIRGLTEVKSGLILFQKLRLEQSNPSLWNFAQEHFLSNKLKLSIENHSMIAGVMQVCQNPDLAALELKLRDYKTVFFRIIDHNIPENLTNFSLEKMDGPSSKEIEPLVQNFLAFQMSLRYLELKLGLAVHELPEIVNMFIIATTLESLIFLKVFRIFIQVRAGYKTYYFDNSNLEIIPVNFFETLSNIEEFVFHLIGTKYLDHRWHQTLNNFQSAASYYPNVQSDIRMIKLN